MNLSLTVLYFLLTIIPPFNTFDVNPNLCQYNFSFYQSNIIPNKKPIDLSWIDYLVEVYHIHPHNLKAIDSLTEKLFYSSEPKVFYKYINTDIIILGYDSFPLGIFLNDENQPGYPLYQRSKFLHSKLGIPKRHESFQWIEVVRFSIYYRARHMRHEKTTTEGYSEGFAYDSHTIDNNGNTIVPYGCWFNNAIGSGIYINTGNTLVAKDRNDLKKILGLYINGCLPGSPKSCNYVHDKFFCLKAIEMGYDTIQILDEHMGIVVCSGGCSVENVNGTCPSNTTLRQGYLFSKYIINTYIPIIPLCQYRYIFWFIYNCF